MASVIDLWRYFRAWEAIQQVVKERETAMGKALVTSKTFWFNLLSGAGQVIGIASGVIPEKYAAVTAGVQSIINIFLRMITTQPITGVITTPDVPPATPIK